MTIEDQLRTLISKELGLDEAEITRDATFREDLRADSLDSAEIAIVTEEKFGIAIDDDIADELETFGAYADYVSKLVDRKNAKGAA